MINSSNKNSWVELETWERHQRFQVAGMKKQIESFWEQNYITLRERQRMEMGWHHSSSRLGEEGLVDIDLDFLPIIKFVLLWGRRRHGDPRRTSSPLLVTRPTLRITNIKLKFTNYEVHLHSIEWEKSGSGAEYVSKGMLEAFAFCSLLIPSAAVHWTQHNNWNDWNWLILGLGFWLSVN